MNRNHTEHGTTYGIPRVEAAPISACGPSYPHTMAHDTNVLCACVVLADTDNTYRTGRHHFVGCTRSCGCNIAFTEETMRLSSLAKDVTRFPTPVAPPTHRND